MDHTGNASCRGLGYGENERALPDSRFTTYAGSLQWLLRPGYREPFGHGRKHTNLHLVLQKCQSVLRADPGPNGWAWMTTVPG